MNRHIREEGVAGPSRFGYEGRIWGLTFVGLLAGWWLRVVIGHVLPLEAWAEVVASLSAMVIAGGIVGGFARWRHHRRWGRLSSTTEPRSGIDGAKGPDDGR